jgi:hypothetical protein
MRSVIAFTMTALVLGMLIAIPTEGIADEPVKITGEVKELRQDGMSLQVIPTDRGVFIVVGQLVKERPATVMLLEGARPVQVQVAGDWKTMVVHRELEERLAAETRRFITTP